LKACLFFIPFFSRHRRVETNVPIKLNESKTGNQISDILNENEKQSARQETQGRIPIVGRRK
jgi:hypothetical protein